jgi:hypothetical protein
VNEQTPDLIVFVVTQTASDYDLGDINKEYINIISTDELKII